MPTVELRTIEPEKMSISGFLCRALAAEKMVTWRKSMRKNTNVSPRFPCKQSRAELCTDSIEV